MTKKRIELLSELLESGVAGTQDEIREKLLKAGFETTQSTISRDLRKLGAVKAIDERGRTIYRFPLDAASAPPPLPTSSLNDLVISIQSNGSLIVVKTTPGSASLIASHIDHYLANEVLGTIAGDDTIFVAPRSVKSIQKTTERIRNSLLVE